MQGDNMENIIEETEVIENIELTIKRPENGTLIKCKDPNGLDQTPVPIVIPESDKYSVGRITVNGEEREEVFWKDYATLVYYSDVRIEEGKPYTVFGRIVASPGYTFNDPVTLVVNGVEQSLYATEDYSLELNEFFFYADI